MGFSGLVTDRRCFASASRRWAMLTVFALVSACAYGLAGTPWAAASAPTATVSPASGVAGSSVTASGGGFRPGESVKVSYATGLSAPDPTGVVVCTAKATTSGTYRCPGRIPSGTSAGADGAHSVKASGGSSGLTVAATFTLVPPLGGVTTMVSDGKLGYCALLSSGGVDCWGEGDNGELGDGTFSSSAAPVPVEGVGGNGTLSGVASLSSAGDGYCALLSSGGVDCWGFGQYGQLGDGTFYRPPGDVGSAVPVEVEEVGGNGTLGGVTGLTGGGWAYCAVLSSGAVDCWGYDVYGELGDGRFDTTQPFGSAVPVAVQGVAGTGTLGGVVSVTSDNNAGFCALSSSSGVDCWGRGPDGELGDGVFYTSLYQGSAVPVAVEGVAGTGTLSGVAQLTGNLYGYCAVLISGAVDCWGGGAFGELGDGTFSESAVPVHVQGVGGTGSLNGVGSVTSDMNQSYCALLNSGGVDCWGRGLHGELGDGVFYTTGNKGSAVPVQAAAAGGTGTLSGVTGVSDGPAGNSYCALVTAGGMDCWGAGKTGQLGDGVFYTTGNQGSALPVQVAALGGNGTVSDVTGMTGDGAGYCALLGSSGVDCWGRGQEGQLGNGTFSKSAIPVGVEG